jgi:tetratricopeptide (TPR) repeat protein
MGAYVGRGEVPPGYLRYLGGHYEWLNERDHNEEAYEIVRLMLEGVGHVSDPTDRKELSYRAWRSKAITIGFPGSWREAIDAYERAISFGEQGGYLRAAQLSDKPYSVAQYEPGNYRELGSLYWRVGDFGSASANFRVSEERLEEVRPRLSAHVYEDEKARLLNALALMHLDLGEYEKADERATEAAMIQENLGGENPYRFLQAAIDYTTAGRARRERARRDGESYAPCFAAFGDALRVLERAPAYGIENADRESEARLERGRAHVLDGDYRAALEDFKAALALASDFNLVQHAGEHHLYLGEARLELEDLPPAREDLEEAVALAERHGTPETLWRGRHALARVLMAEGYPERARNELKECIGVIEQLRSQQLPESSRISMLELKDRPYEDLVVDLCDLGSVQARAAEAPEITEAFGYVERAKSRVLAEQLAARDLKVPAGVPTELADEERELAGSLRALQASESRANAAAGAYDLRARLADAERRLRQARDRIRASGAGGEEYVSMREAAPLDYASVRRLLATHGAELGYGDVSEGTGRVVMVDYFVAEEKVLAFVGRADLEAPRLYEIGVSRDALHDWAEVLAGLGPGNHLDAWDLEAWQLELGGLVEPIGECSEEGDVVWIVPHRELHRLPLHALELSGRYLADRNPVFYTPSASVLRYSEAKNRGQALETALVFGDSLPLTDPLEHAREEARAVAAIFGAEAYLGDRATKGALERELQRTGGEVDVLHFACHGRFEPDAPLASRIELAPEGAEGDRQPDLTAEDVLGMDLEAALVTLSACESGLSRIHAGEELVGLTRAFLYAGTPSLVASLWSVDDESTGALIEHFYRNLVGSPPGGAPEAPMSKARALRAAQRHLKDDGRFGHPFYWSPFVLVGDWK